MAQEKSSTALPVKATPYRHQQAAFEFACRMFGLTEGGDGNGDSSSDLRSVRDENRKEAGGNT
jgi:hypothetical protein